MDIRNIIEEKYDNLKQLEGYEKLIASLNNDSKNHWWNILTPRIEVSINTDKSRDKFIMFIQDEINRIKSELGIDEGGGEIR